MKQYFTGFFTAVCLTASVFLFMGFQNKNLGDIEVNSITVRAPGGKKVVWLGPAKSGNGVLETYNANGKETAYLGGKTGHLVTYNEREEMTGYFGTNAQSDGMILLNDKYGEQGWAKLVSNR